MIRRLNDFANSDKGATAIEYALIGVLVSIMILAGVTSTGTTLSGFFTSVASAL